MAVCSDLAALLADPAAVPVEHIPALIGELEKMKAVLFARLADAARPVAAEPPITAKEAARRLGVGVDWVRDHGGEKGLEIRLSAGTVRYDPVAVARLIDHR